MPIDAYSKLNLIKSDPEAIATIFGVGIEPEDTVLYSRLAGDYKKYEELLLDPQVRGKLSERVGALLGRDVIVEPATKSDADLAAAELAEDMLQRSLLPYEQICQAYLMSGLLIGFAVQAITGTAEKEYSKEILNDDGEVERIETRRLILPTLEFVPQRRFVFRYFEPEKVVPVAGDDEIDPETDQVIVNGYELRLLTKRAPFDGERCPKNRFLPYTFGSIKGLPTGYGLGAQIRKFYEIRKEALKSGVLTGDRLGAPPTHGTYPADLDQRDPDQAAVIGAFTRLVQAISPNAYAVTTDGFKIDFPGGAVGGHQILKWLYDTAGVEISRAIWGEGSYAEKSTGSYAAEAQQSENRNENIVDSDANGLDEQLSGHLWRIIAELNYPKANAPTIRRETYSDRRQAAAEAAEEEKRSARIAADRTLIVDFGLTVAPEYVKATYGEAFSFPEQTTPEALDTPDLGGEGETTTEELPTDGTPVEPAFSDSADFGANVHHYIEAGGLRIGVRNMPGETRFPQHRSAKKLQSGYGFVEGRQNDKKRALRVYIAPGLFQSPAIGQASPVFGIRQIQPATGAFDELKLMVGYGSAAEAESAYKREMPAEFFGGIEPFTAEEQFSESPDPESEDSLDAYETRLSGDLTEALGGAIARIQQFAEEVASGNGTDAEKYRRFQEGLFDLYSELPTEAIAQVLGEGFAAGYAAGMFSERVDR